MTIVNHWNSQIWHSSECVSEYLECLTKKVRQETKKKKLGVLIRLTTVNLSKICVLASESH